MCMFMKIKVNLFIEMTVFVCLFFFIYSILIFQCILYFIYITYRPLSMCDQLCIVGGLVKLRRWSS